MFALLKKKGPLILVWALLVLISRSLKLDVGVGGEKAGLSLLPVTLPLIACFFRWHVALPLLALGWICTHIGANMPITLGLPTLAATLSWRASQNPSYDRLFHILLPLGCMAAFFVAMPNAFPYTFYWLIPIGLSFLSPSKLTGGLKSTFIAHAVGSVLWVYQLPGLSEYWMGLIPIVAFERLLTVFWMLGCFTIFHLVSKKSQSVAFS